MLARLQLLATGDTVVPRSLIEFSEKEPNPHLEWFTSQLPRRSISRQVIPSILDIFAYKLQKLLVSFKMSGVEVAGLVLAGVGAAAGVKTASDRSRSGKSEVCCVKRVTDSWLIGMLINLFVSLGDGSRIS